MVVECVPGAVAVVGYFPAVVVLLVVVDAQRAVFVWGSAINEMLTPTGYKKSGTALRAVPPMSHQ